MKKILLGIVLLLGAVSCEYVEDRGTSVEFTTVRRTQLYDIVYDNDTRVMYYQTNDGTLTVLLNEDGTPRTWKGEDEEPNIYREEK